MQAQSLNEYLAMFATIYGKTANYGKSKYELIAHLVEVTGAFGKFAFKKRDYETAQSFLPKMFAWACALVTSVKADANVLERMILSKYPTVCPYCRKSPCECNQPNKQSINYVAVRDLYHRLTPSQGRAPNDIQSMLRSIYEKTWRIAEVVPGSPEASSALMALYTRLTEELSEMAEAVRFHHLYPSNFDNEVADYMSWWFAIVSSFHILSNTGDMLLAEDILWEKYPGVCPTCTLPVCDCRPGPVREMLSKPSLGYEAKTDALTQVGNRMAYDDELRQTAATPTYLPTPLACIRVDVDDFKSINDRWSHVVGDDALRYLATTLRQKIRSRDRLFRVGGDEFAILCPDLSAAEAQGMLGRAAEYLKRHPINRKLGDGSGFRAVEITLSIGVVECDVPERILDAFESADLAALRSKNEGKDRISVGSLN